MAKLKKVIRDVLKNAREETRGGALTELGRHVRYEFNNQLGGIDVFATEKEWTGGLLRSVFDTSGVAIMYHLGGTLRRMHTEHGRTYYEIVGGVGRAFKFMPHPENEPVGKRDFFGVGFPYNEYVIVLYKVTGGSVARVKADVQRMFSIDALGRVTADGIEDVRLYQCGGELADNVQILFEETISDVGGEWDKIFRLLNS